MLLSAEIAYQSRYFIVIFLIKHIKGTNKRVFPFAFKDQSHHNYKFNRSFTRSHICDFRNLHGFIEILEYYAQYE